MLTFTDVLREAFRPGECDACGKRRPCYRDPETKINFCLSCLEIACTPEPPEPDFSMPDDGNGGFDRTNPTLRTVGTR